MLKTIDRWTLFPIASYKYARECGCSRKKALKFALEMSAGCQWENLPRAVAWLLDL